MALKQMLVVTRDGTLSSDQLFLLYFLRWVTASTPVEVEVLSWHEGPVTADLREITSVRVMEELDRWRPARLFEVLRLRRIAQALKGVRLRWWLHRRRHADVVYVNGFEAARIVGYLGSTHPPVVVHVHDPSELDSPRLTEADRATIVDRAARFVAASDEVADHLRDRFTVAGDRVVRHDHFVAGADHLPASTERPTRAHLGLDPDALVVGGIGSTDWWASPDQFVLLAWALRRRRPELSLRFVWIAGDADDKVLWPLRHDLANAGVDDLTVVACGRRPLDYLAVMDALVLSTRAESQELIALEAAASGVLVVATDNLARSGSIAEIAVVVPYLDVDALADALLALVEVPAEREARVDRARTVARRHHDVGVGAAELLDVLGSVT